MVLMSLVKSPIRTSLYNDGIGTRRPVLRFLSEPDFGGDRGGHTRTFREATGTGGYGYLGRHPPPHPGGAFRDRNEGHEAEREELARLLHDRHPRTLQPAQPG